MTSASARLRYSLGQSVEDLSIALGKGTQVGHEILVGLHPVDLCGQGVDDDGVDADAPTRATASTSSARSSGMRTVVTFFAMPL